MTAINPDAFYNDVDCCCEILGAGTESDPYTIIRCEEHCGPERTWADMAGNLTLAAVCCYFLAHVVYALYSWGFPVHA